MTTAYIGLGANLPSPAGPPEATLAAAAERMASLGRIVGRSRLYSTTPVGLADQPRFLNAAIALETEPSPRSLLQGLLAIERNFGRDRTANILNGPRTLDLDILLFGDFVVSEPDLKIPHPRLSERAFVLVPLSEIAPQARDPRTGASVLQLRCALFPNSGSERQAVFPVESSLWRPGPDCDDAGASCP